MTVARVAIMKRGVATLESWSGRKLDSPKHVMLAASCKEERLMTILCPACSALTIKKNGPIHNGKQNHQCAYCGRQSILTPEKKCVPEEEREKIRQALLKRVSLEGICRIFNVSMPWLLKFIDEIIHELPERMLLC